MQQEKKLLLKMYWRSSVGMRRMLINKILVNITFLMHPPMTKGTAIVRRRENSNESLDAFRDATMITGSKIEEATTHLNEF